MRILFLLSLSFLLTTVLSAQNRFDLVIDEIMIDPSPQIGLPNNEWIELKNTSSSSINLLGWRIGDSGGQSGAMPDFTLQPGHYVIVCTGSAVAALSAFGNTISITSFPSLDNDGELLYLKAPSGQIIHAIDYSASWYQNELKKEGGWTLEMIDTQNPCTGESNWKASTNNSGGTPGSVNSVSAVNNDDSEPQLKNAYAIDNTTVVLVFDEPLDSLSAATTGNYTIDGGLTFSSAESIVPLFTQVNLKTSVALAENKVYNVVASNLTDCKSNMIGTANRVKVGLSKDANAGSVVINEILFNPRSNAYDYIEICYNKSDQIFDASKLFFANRNSSGLISSITQISMTPFYLFPGDFIVATEDADNLALNYLVQDPQAVIAMNTLPSFPDDTGFVLLLNQQGNVVDEVNYSDDWHFKLLDNAEGVSLERVNAEAPSKNADNWHSAASTAGYGTPGYKNSQDKNVQQIGATIAVTPKVFSPDNDGFDDIATIQYKIDQPGYVANITIFDAAGRPIRNLVRNGTMTTNGYWNWDGLDDKGLKLPVGNYIIFTEIFNLEGKKDKFKNNVVLARRLN